LIVDRIRVSELGKFDLFICHAGEDKTLVVRPLARELAKRGLRVWLDELELTIGDTLNGRIEAALAESRFAVVVISPAFFAKRWPQRELAGLAARELHVGGKVILPVWHEVDAGYIAERSPVLADRVGALTSEGLSVVADKIKLAFDRGIGAGREMTSIDELQRTRPGARRRGLRWLTLLGVSLSAAAGFTMVPGVARSHASQSLPNSASNQVLEVAMPVSWERRSALVRSVAPQLAEELSLESVSSEGALVIGVAQSSSATLLPDDLLTSMVVMPRKETVKVGPLIAYRYREVKPQGSGVVETVYAIPTTAGILIGLCPLGVVPRSSEGVCEQILGSLKLLSGKLLRPGPRPTYADAIRDALTRLNAERAMLDRQFAKTTSADAQASVASRIASMYQRAAGEARSADPGPVESRANRLITVALSSMAHDYYRVADAAQHRDMREFQKGRAGASNDAWRIAQGVRQLANAGYDVEAG
jgi:TIR domain